MSIEGNEWVDWIHDQTIINCLQYTIKVSWIFECVNKGMDGRVLSRMGRWINLSINGQLSKVVYGWRESKKKDKSLNWWVSI